MTVTLAGTAGDLPDWESTQFEATVNELSALVYARTQDMHLDSDSPYLEIDTPSQQSVLKFTYDEPVTVVLTTLDPVDIETLNFYPTRSDVTVTLSGRTATFTIPVDDEGVDLWVEINDDRQNVLHLIAQPPLDEVLTLDGNGDVQSTNWTSIGPKSVSNVNTGTNVITTSSAHGWSVGQKVHYYTTGTYPADAIGSLNALDIYYVKTAPAENTLTLARTSGGAEIDFTSAGSGTHTISTASYSSTTHALYFGPGEHRIGMLFDLGDDVEVYADHGAVVIGSFDVRNVDGVLMHGPGVIAGTFASTQSGQPFGTLIGYSMIYGYDSVSAKFEFDNRVEGLTFLVTPGLFNFYGIWSCRYIQVISPWEANTDGFSILRKASDDLRAEVFRCYSYLGDDATHLENPIGTVSFAKSFFIQSANGSPFLLSYTKKLVSGDYTQTISDCHAMTLAGPDPDGFEEWPYRGFTSIVKSWTDANDVGEIGPPETTFTNLQVWGPLQSRFASIQSLPYEFVGPATGRGTASGLVFNDCVVHETPGQISTIDGLDAKNYPVGFTINRMTIGGVPVGARNFDDFFSVGEVAVNVIVDGKAIA